MSVKSTERFSDRVENYVKFRPSYPVEILEPLKRSGGLTSNSVIADIGSGTGISAKIFLQNGNQVFAVEPNEAMRTAGDRYLQEYKSQFKSLSGTSEATGLPDGSVDFVIAAQAFHWFKPEPTKQEFARILRPGGRVALIWNDRKITGSEFSIQYEQLLVKFGTDYTQVNHKQVNTSALRESDSVIQKFLGPHDVFHFVIYQDLNFEGLLGRVLSSSYAPNEDDPNFPSMQIALKELFARHETNGLIRIEYDTQVFLSHAW